MRPILALAATAAVVCLAGCGNAPQQPSDVVDDQSAESPYVETDGTAGAAGDTVVPPVEETPASTIDTSEVDDTSPVEPIQTGAAVAQSSDFNAIAGRWAPTQGECGADNTVSTITAEIFERPGRSCQVAELIDAGQGSVTAALICESGAEGTEERELLRLSLVDDQLNLNVVGTQNPPTLLVRCTP